MRHINRDYTLRRWADVDFKVSDFGAGFNAASLSVLSGHPWLIVGANVTALWGSALCAFLEAAEHQKNDNDTKDKSESSARVITPIPAVRPTWQYTE
jgi:hypothetical protein